ncbi:MAG: carbon-nitrogen hydrolase family protein [Deltaproteobacteria bacterium]|nr:carbon-nitrogen hydrolase family protein [Deltaproteobacteria bacterium]
MGDRYPKLKLAAVQAAPVFLDREATVDKACRLIEEAGAGGAVLVGFPECYVPGFPRWYRFRTLYDCGELYRALFANSVEVPSEATEQLCAAARKAGLYVVMGINERDPGTLGTMYNSQLFISREGVLLGRRRKIMPTLGERLVHKAGDGTGLRVFPTAFGPLGGLICGENTNSLARFALLAQGERFHVASWPPFPTPDNVEQRRAIEIQTRYHALEGRVFVISACGVVDDRMIAMICETETQRQLVVDSGGFSAIIGPAGEYLAGPQPEGEGILYAEADLEAIVAGKYSHDLVGHYNRFDLLSLVLRDGTAAPLVWGEAGVRQATKELPASDLLEWLLRRLPGRGDRERTGALREAEGPGGPASEGQGGLR